MTEQQVLSKLTALCARSEHCQQDMIDKMRKWEVDETVQARIMEYLLRESFVDDARYARFFINDKIKFNRWGKQKVAQALRMKRIAESVYAPMLDEVQDENYLETLRPLIQAKRRSVKGNSDYEIRGKLIRFALSRGFDMDLILKVLDEEETDG